ncbi:adenylate isopentenyltransferase 5, chloroplastic-like [Punica granatum]|uniref:Adenylate isopentenyltransferase 5, chloroplastic-like n=2 Tax=Punica granatum TaxID=22663 RepID=A0A6P8EJC6_PUNGR|nr:adenylate isopentenyltransferase 5, chloroplastic-like [Punica granatum]PKI48161.1 hypothetical protein CRG98_031426 [Punica granatum]
MNAAAVSAAYMPVQSLVMNFQGEAKARDPFCRQKVVFVMGATGTGKSRLAIDLATRYPAEVINSDKMQVYKGLDIVTNKVKEEEWRGVPHHLMSFVDPDSDFTATDFRYHASKALQTIYSRGRIPIIAGGSNSFIDALVNDDPEFRLMHDCCFLWVDVSWPVLQSFLSERVDQMVREGLVEEVRSLYSPEGDYNRGNRRSIGVPEMDQYFRAEATADDQTRKRLLEACIAKIKENTSILTQRQLQKIHRLNSLWNWSIHRIDATEVFSKRGKLEADEAWKRLIGGPSAVIVGNFLFNEQSAGIPILPTTRNIQSTEGQ